MIDTARFEFLMVDAAFYMLEGKGASIFGGVKLYGNGFYLKGEYSSSGTRINFDLGRRVFWVELSLPKFVQGHNVFGTNRLIVLCREVIERVYGCLGIELSKREWGKIEESGIGLMRLDIACSFRVGSSGNVNAVLESLFEHLRAESVKWSAHGAAYTEAVYNRQRSKRVSDKFYNKHRELMANKIHPAVKARNLLMKYAESIVRYEVTFRGAELKSLGLEFADQWNTKVVREIIESRINRLKLTQQFQSSDGFSRPVNLNDCSNMFLDLWLKGADLHVYKNCKTLQRARFTLIDKCGVDIFKAADSRESLDLSEVLSPENAIFNAPKRLVKLGAIFGLN